MSDSTRVLLVGNGAREHALAEAILRGPGQVELISAPGNAGLARLGRCVPLPDDSPDALVRLALENMVDLVVIGPESPLVQGAADALRAAGVACFGPGAAGARLEGSKAYGKEFLRRHHIPTADFRVFESYPHARSYVTQSSGPCVIKADGLAGGRGAFVVETGKQADQVLHQLMVERVLGEAGMKVVVEERLEGAEASLFLLLNGMDAVAFPLARDFKRLQNGDLGPNTGGMGAVVPHPMTTPAIWKRLNNKVIEPLLQGLVEDRIEYRGLLYVGLMLTAQGPMVLEFNCCFGESETQPLTLMCDGPWLPMLDAAARGETMDPPDVRDGCALARVIAGGGYPDGGGLPVVLRGLEEADRVEGAKIFHAATYESLGEIWGGPGRMLTICAAGGTLETVAERVEEATACLQLEGAQWRTDLVEGALDVPVERRVETRYIRAEAPASERPVRERAGRSRSGERTGAAARPFEKFRPRPKREPGSRDESRPRGEGRSSGPPRPRGEFKPREGFRPGGLPRPRGEFKPRGEFRPGGPPRPRRESGPRDESRPSRPRGEFKPREGFRPGGPPRPRGEFKPRGEFRPGGPPRARRESGPRDESRPSRPRGEFKPREGFRPGGPPRPRGEFKPREGFRPGGPRRESGPRDESRPSRPRGEFKPREGFRPGGPPRPRGEFKPRGEFRPGGPPRARRESSPRDESRPSRPREGFKPREGFRPGGPPRPRGEFKPRGEFRPGGPPRPRGEFKPRDERRPGGSVRPPRPPSGSDRPRGSVGSRRPTGGGPSKRPPRGRPPRSGRQG